MKLKARTRYRCTREGCTYYIYTGYDSQNPTKVLNDPDDTCPRCGATLIELLEDDGIRYRLTWELTGPYDAPGTFHPVVKEHKNLHDAREQWNGLHNLIEQGIAIRNIKVEVSTTTWEEVNW